MLLSKITFLLSLSVFAAAQLGGFFGGILDGFGNLGNLIGGLVGGAIGNGNGGTGTSPATPAPTPGNGGSPPTDTSCNTGPVMCCNSVGSSNEQAVAILMSLLGIDLSGVDINVGVNCSPVGGADVGGGSSCTANPVCCENIQYNGLVGVACNPVSI